MIGNKGKIYLRIIFLFKILNLKVKSWKIFPDNFIEMARLNKLNRFLKTAMFITFNLSDYTRFLFETKVFEKKKRLVSWLAIEFYRKRLWKE